MNFDLNEDQAGVSSFLEKMLAPFRQAWKPGQRFEYSHELDRQIEQAGFLDVANEDSLGTLVAALMVYEVARLPVSVEVAASALVRPRVCPELPRPLSIIWADPAAPVRFLPVSKSVILVEGEDVFGAEIAEGDVIALDSMFSYPMGALKRRERLPAKKIAGVKASELRDVWRIAVAAEMTGSLQSALDAVVDHVTQRTQFGRPLGSFQAIQHRLAECASMLQASRWLMLRAADTLQPQQVAVAAGYAQDLSAKVVYDLHQFMGAMGLTLEHPLHRWTYRARLLRSDLGGAAAQFTAAAHCRWLADSDKEASRARTPAVGLTHGA